MKVYTMIELEWDGESYVEVYSESYEWEGEVAHAGGGGDTTSVQKSDPWEGQQPYLTDLYQQAQDFFQQGTPQLLQTQRVTRAGGESIEQGAGAARGIASSAAQGQQFLSGGDVLSPETNPALQQYIDLANQATTRSFTEGVLPALRGQSVQAGNVGSSRAGIAQGLAAQGLGRQIAQQTAGLTSAAYGQGLDAMGRGLALAPQTATLQGAPGALLTQAGQNYALADQIPYNQQTIALQNYQNLIQGNPGGTTTITGPGTQTGGLSGALGGAAIGHQIGGGYGAAAGAIAGYFS